MAELTHRALQAMKSGVVKSDGGARGGGVLVARRESKGVLFYFRYTRPDGTRDSYPLGAWTSTGGELSLEAARSRSLELSARYRAGDRDLRAILEGEQREARRLRAEEVRAIEEASMRQHSTLAGLLAAYVADLKRRSKSSADEVERTFRRHFLVPWPKLATKPANDVTLDDLLAVIARVVDAGHARQAGKLRSHIQAAYTAGIRARQSASAGAELRALKITTNPARDLAPVEGASGTKERVLSLAELRAYWARIVAMPNHRGAPLRFHLLTGGQRVAQLARTKVIDIDRDSGCIRVWDGKGRRLLPRAHWVPLIEPAFAAVEDMSPERTGEFVFTATGGRSGINPSNLRDRFVEVTQAMDEAGELPGGPVTLGSIRMTVETRLAALGFSKDIRAQFQSHGLNGVQDKHYDRHDYLPEKLEAMQALYEVATGIGEGNVIQFRKRAG